MTNFRAKGFDSPSQLHEHLAELDDDSPADDFPAVGHRPFVEQQMAMLRQEISDLTNRVSALREEAQVVGMHASKADLYPWIGAAVVMATTFVFWRLVVRQALPRRALSLFR